MSRPTSRNGAVRRIGFVGTGGVADRHASVLGTFGDVELVAATDTDPGRAAEFGGRHGTAAVAGLDELLDRDLHAVYIGVPPFAHGPVETAVAAAGVALFVEKPLGRDVATAEDVGAALDRSGVLTRVGHHWRCAEPVRRAREILAGRTVRLVTASWLDKVPPVPWWTDRELSGGPLVEQAVHVLDTARLLAGEVDEVHALSAGPMPGGSVDTATAGLLRFRSGAVGTVSTTCMIGRKHRAGCEVVADGVVVAVGEDWLEVDDGTGPQRAEYDRWTALQAADRSFVDALHGRDAPGGGLPDHAEARRSHRLACALARSAATGTAQDPS
jgi:myo-inositol 2-dehydrogenase/D-chiro-inositol 1-dehydrogenase